VSAPHLRTLGNEEPDCAIFDGRFAQMQNHLVELMGRTNKVIDGQTAALSLARGIGDAFRNSGCAAGTPFPPLCLMPWPSGG